MVWLQSAKSVVYLPDVFRLNVQIVPLRFFGSWKDVHKSYLQYFAVILGEASAILVG